MLNIIASAFKNVFGEEVNLITPINAHATNKKLYRVSSKTNKAIASINPQIKDESRFVKLTESFRILDLPVPEIYLFFEDFGFSLMEDLGEQTLLEVLEESRTDFLKINPGGDECYFCEDIFSLYSEGLKALPKFQIKYIQNLDFDKFSEFKKFDSKKMIEDMNYFYSEYISRCNIKCDLLLLQKDFLVLAEFLNKVKIEYFMYRDFQARNIVINKAYKDIKKSRISFIDYQDGIIGPLQYDVASLLFQSSARIPAQAREKLLGVYLQHASQYATIDNDEFVDYYYGFVLIRIMQVLGKYGELGIGKGKKYFVESIPFALENYSSIRDKISIQKSIPYLISIFDQIVNEPSK